MRHLDVYDWQRGRGLSPWETVQNVLPEVFSEGTMVSLGSPQGPTHMQTFHWEIGCFLTLLSASLVAQMLKYLPAVQETWVQSLGQEDPLEKEMSIHSSTLAWKIPWTEEPGGLQSTGSQRVGHDWATSLSLSPCYLSESEWHRIVEYHHSDKQEPQWIMGPKEEAWEPLLSEKQGHP